jgi:hypothetical protein
VDALGNAGLSSVSVVQRFDCFRGTSKERTARKYGVSGVNVIAVKPR